MSIINSITQDYNVSDVFSVGNNRGTPAYVERKIIGLELKNALNSNKHITLFGESKQGKTWLREKYFPSRNSIVIQAQREDTLASLFDSALQEIGHSSNYEISDVDESGESLSKVSSSGYSATIHGVGVSNNTERIKETNSTISASISKYYDIKSDQDIKRFAKLINDSGKRLIIEDFHYISSEVQRHFAYVLKALFEYGCYVLLVGVWDDEHLLTYYNGDLEGRIEDIRVTWTNKELQQALTQGLNALKIETSEDIINDIVESSCGNIGLLHRIAEEYCLYKDHFTLQECKVRLAGKMSRFNKFVSSFISGMRGDVKTYGHILRAVVETGDDALIKKGIKQSELINKIRDFHPELNLNSLYQCLDRTSQIQFAREILPPGSLLQ